MEVKLFGKKIFEYKSSKSSMYFERSSEQMKKSDYLPDFYSMRANEMSFSDMMIVSPSDIEPMAKEMKAKEKGKKKSQVVTLTPKGVYELKLLNDDNFKLNTDSDYIDDQLQSFKDKLDLVKTSEFDIERGLTEISSIVARLENRKKYGEFNEFFEEFAYTTTSKIEELLKVHDYLKCGKVEQFLADMPKDAVEVMKRYTSKTKDLCDKKAVFYIIADKKDFKKTEKRRDPILLAQSPFGHFWQILGAWDKEMLLLEEL